MSEPASTAASALGTASLSPRRGPAQARAQQRLARIVEAAESLLVERGFEALTLAEVARRAGVNIATVYERFPNRAALLRALAQHYTTELQAIVVAGLGTIARGGDLLDAADALVDAVHAFHLANPAYLAIWSGAQSHPELKALDAADTEANARALGDVLHRALPRGSGTDVGAVALTALLAVGHILRHAAASPDPGRLVAQAKRLVRAYLVDVTQSARSRNHPRPAPSTPSAAG